MSTQTSKGRGRTGARPVGDLKRSIQYRLTRELRRLERNGFDESTYASAIRHALNVLPEIRSVSVLVLFERELIRGEKSKRDRPYAGVLSSLLSRIGDPDASCSKLFAYYLDRLENEGRGNEPFARALRRALDSGGSKASTHFLYDGDEDQI